MSAITVWLLVSVGGGSYSSPSTLATLNDEAACRRAAQMLYIESKDRRGAPYVHSFCIPVAAKALVVAERSKS